MRFAIDLETIIRSNNADLSADFNLNVASHPLLGKVLLGCCRTNLFGLSERWARANIVGMEVFFFLRCYHQQLRLHITAM